MRYFGLLLLSIWLFLDSSKALFKFHFPYQQWVTPGFALVSGVVLLLYSLRNLFGNLGLSLLSIWLVLFSTMEIFRYNFPSSDMTLAVLGFVTAFFLLIRK